MDTPSFNLGVDLVVEVAVPLSNVTSHEDLGFQLGLNPSMLDAECLAKIGHFGCQLKFVGLKEEAQANQATQFLSEDPEFQCVLTGGGSTLSFLQTADK